MTNYKNMPGPAMNSFIAIAKALSDGNRVRALLALRAGELCVCQIIELLKLAPSTVSKHMSILKQAGLVESRKEERWIYYRLPAATDQTEMTRKALKLVVASLGLDTQGISDRQRLADILKIDREVLCRNRLMGHEKN
jgi:DNA-binding transcriptional ArsR family regulator